jgi:hypothetical protein
MRWCLNLPKYGYYVVLHLGHLHFLMNFSGACSVLPVETGVQEWLPTHRRVLLAACVRAGGARTPRGHTRRQLSCCCSLTVWCCVLSTVCSIAVQLLQSPVWVGSRSSGPLSGAGRRSGRGSGRALSE